MRHNSNLTNLMHLTLKKVTSLLILLFFSLISVAQRGQVHRSEWDEDPGDDWPWYVNLLIIAVGLYIFYLTTMNKDDNRKK